MWVVAKWHYIYQLTSPKKRLVDLYQGEPKGMTTKKSLQITQVIVFYRCSVPAAHTNLIFRPIHLKHDLHLFMEVMLFHITVASLPPFSNQSNIEPPPQNHWFGKIWWNERMKEWWRLHFIITALVLSQTCGLSYLSPNLGTSPSIGDCSVGAAEAGRQL